MVVLTLTSCAPTGSKPDSQKVDSNQLVILKDNESYGVFKLFDQTHEPETAKYQWSIFEKDLDDESLTEIKTGDGFAGHDPIGFFSFYKDVPIEFGSFRLKWSINTTDRGWVYFKSNNAKAVQSYCIPKNYRTTPIESLINTCQFKVCLLYTSPSPRD